MVTVGCAWGEFYSFGSEQPTGGSNRVRQDQVDRAAADLHADFQRQENLLRQAQFDSLVLRRNLFPTEMSALHDETPFVGSHVSDIHASAPRSRGQVFAQFTKGRAASESCSPEGQEGARIPVRC
jgi:hypothetical protein